MVPQNLRLIHRIGIGPLPLAIMPADKKIMRANRKGDEKTMAPSVVTLKNPCRRLAVQGWEDVNGSDFQGVFDLLRILIERAWAGRSSASAKPSTRSPIASRPSLLIIWTVERLQKC